MFMSIKIPVLALMTYTLRLAPLRGIPSNIPAGTRTPVAAQAQTRAPPRALPEKKGGIKVLDINEQPVGFSAKRRKKTLGNKEILIRIFKYVKIITVMLFLDT